MSLILDALKRAERERRLERPRDLSAVYEEDATPRHGIQTLIWLGGAFLIGAVVVGLFLWPRSPGSGPSPQITENRTPKAASALPPGRKAVPPSSASLRSNPSKTLASAPVQKPKPPSEPASVQKSPPVKAQKPRLQSAASPTAPPPPTSDAQEEAGMPTTDQTAHRPVRSEPDLSYATAKPLPVKETGPPVSEEVSADPPPSDPDLQSQEAPLDRPPVAESPSSPLAVAKTPVDPDTWASVPLLTELPFDVRQRLGTLQINVHAYSEDPAECLVFINMRRLKIGDRVGNNGPVLKAITPDGVVLDYGEGQARLQVWK